MIVTVLVLVTVSRDRDRARARYYQKPTASPRPHNPGITFSPLAEGVEMIRESSAVGSRRFHP